MKKLPNSLKNIIIIILATCISLFLAEVGLRGLKLAKDIIQNIYKKQGNDSSDAYEDVTEYYGKHSTIAKMEYNTYLGYIPRASFVADGYRTNWYHFRYDEDFAVEKEENEVRIFITGGSTAWGAGVVQEKLYSKVMEDLFKKGEFSYLKIRVISAGVGAYGTVQERIMIENFILQLSPDFVIMFSGWNDSYYGYRGKDILINQDYFNYRKILEGESENDVLSPPNYYEYLFKTHLLIDKAIYQFKYSSRESMERTIRENALKPECVIQTLLRNVHIVSDLSKRYNFKLIFYLQPSVYSTKKHLTDWEKSLLKNGKKKQIGFPEYNQDVYSMYREVLPKDAQQNRYYFVDGDNAIQNEKKSVFADYVHFGDRGNCLIANHMFTELRKLMRLFDAK